MASRTIEGLYQTPQSNAFRRDWQGLGRIGAHLGPKVAADVLLSVVVQKTGS